VQWTVKAVDADVKEETQVVSALVENAIPSEALVKLAQLLQFVPSYV
jgi:hypothetical protein